MRNRVVPEIEPVVVLEEGEAASARSEVIAIEDTNAHLRKQQLEETKRSKCIVSISTPWRVKWDIFVIFLALYNCFAIPYNVSFQPNAESNIFLEIFDLLVDMLFILDIVIVFRTSYININTGEMVEDARQIAAGYVKESRFYIDVAASVPVGLIGMISGGTSAGLQLIKLLKLVRVMRLNKIIMSMRIRDTTKITLRIGKLILYIIIYVHLIACVWFVVVTQNYIWIPNTDGILDASPFYEESPGYQYCYCFYIGVNSLVGIEIMPQTTSEYTFCLITVFAGALFVSYILGEIADSISSLNMKMNQFYENMETASSIMKSLGIPEQLQLDVSEYMAATYQYILNFEEWNSFNAVVPPSYIKRINEHLYTDLVESQELLSQSPGIVKYMVKRLEYTFINPEELLMQAGDDSNHFYLVVDGVLEVLVKDFKQDSQLVRVLNKADICGEIGLIYNTPRTATIRAKQYSKVAMLNRVHFKEMLTTFAGIEERLLEMINNYDDPFRKSIKRMLYRLPYMRRADKYTLDKVIANLELNSFPPQTILMEYDSIPRHLFLLIEGSVTVNIQLNEKGLARNLNNSSFRSQHKEQTNVFVRKQASKKLSMTVGRHNKYMSSVEAAVLKKGSILCGSQCLLGSKVSMQCQTDKFSTFLLLRAEIIDLLALSDPLLKKALTLSRDRFHFYNSYTNQSIQIPPVLDYIKTFPRGTDPEVKSRARKVQKLKDVAMMSLLRHRKKIKSNLTNFQNLVKKMSAINTAETKGWSGVARLLEKDKLNPEALDAAHMLSDEEVVIPILTQFAALANATFRNIEELQGQFLQLYEAVKALNKMRKDVKDEILEIIEIAGRLKR